jgi:hypothetical protein
MRLKKIAAGAAVAGALAFGSIGIGAGQAQADEWGPWVPWVPHVDDWVPNPLAPGQLAKWCPWHSPPGHWFGGPHGIPCT